MDSDSLDRPLMMVVRESGASPIVSADRRQNSISIVSASAIRVVAEILIIRNLVFISERYRCENMFSTVTSLVSVGWVACEVCFSSNDSKIGSGSINRQAGSDDSRAATK